MCDTLVVEWQVWGHLAVSRCLRFLGNQRKVVSMSSWKMGHGWSFLLLKGEIWNPLQLLLKCVCYIGFRQIEATWAVGVDLRAHGSEGQITRLLGPYSSLEDLCFWSGRCEDCLRISGVHSASCFRRDVSEHALSPWEQFELHFSHWGKCESSLFWRNKSEASSSETWCGEPLDRERMFEASTDREVWRHHSLEAESLMLCWGKQKEQRASWGAREHQNSI